MENYKQKTTLSKRLMDGYVMKSTFAKVTFSIPAEVPMLSAIDALSSAKCCRNSFNVGALKVKVIPKFGVLLCAGVKSPMLLSNGT